MMTDSETLKAAVALLRKQEAKGRAKYGADLDAFGGTATEMIDHAIEEAADQLCYLIKLRDMMSNTTDIPEPKACVWIEHTGGYECPVDGMTMVRVKEGNWSSSEYAYAKNWHWSEAVTHYMIAPDK